MTEPPPPPGDRPDGDATPSEGAASSQHDGRMPPAGWDPSRYDAAEFRRDLAGLSHRLGLLNDRFNGIDDQLEQLTHVGDPTDPNDYRGDLQRLSEAVEAITNDVAEIGEAVNPTDRPDSGGQAVCWVDLDQLATEEAWRGLIGWMRLVLIPRYGDVVVDALPACWFQHPVLVEHLSWLHATWVRAYRDPEARPTQAAEWHARWLPTVLAQLRDVGERCSTSHRPDRGSSDPDAVIDPDGALEAFWRQDASHRPGEVVDAGTAPPAEPQNPPRGPGSAPDARHAGPPPTGPWGPTAPPQFGRPGPHGSNPPSGGPAPPPGPWGR